MIERSLMAIAIVVGIGLAVPTERVIETDRSGAVWEVASGRLLPSLVASPRDAELWNRDTGAFRAQAAQLLARPGPQLVLALHGEGRHEQGGSHDRR